MTLLDPEHIWVIDRKPSGIPYRFALRRCPACGLELHSGHPSDPTTESIVLPDHLYRDHGPEDFNLSPLEDRRLPSRRLAADGGDRR